MIFCFKDKKELISFILSFLIFGFLILADYLYRPSLYKLTLEKVPILQANLSSASKVFFQFVTQLGYGHIGAIIVFITFSISTREKALYLLLVQTTESLLNQIMKLIYHDPRPYFDEEKIEIIGGCAMTYGNPSGHASFTAAVYLSVFLLIFHDKDHVMATGRSSF